MLVSMSNPKDTEKHQKAFETFLYSRLPQTVDLKFGHPGRSFREPVHTNGNLWYFTRLAGQPSPNRYWNAFGLLSSEQPSSIVVEVNFPIQGVNRRIAGILARDDVTGIVKVLHRGGIGGGRKGIGKHAFLDWYRERVPTRFVQVAEGSRDPAECILLGTIGDQGLLEGLIEFARDVLEFKRNVAGRQSHTETRSLPA